jgi:diacylglycerol kinase (ATP)
MTRARLHLSQKTQTVGKMAADPRPGEPRSRSERRQLTLGESATDRPGVARIEQGAGRQPSERADGQIRKPVPLDLAHHDSVGGQSAPLKQQALGLGEVEVVEQHRRDDVVERLVTKRQLANVGVDDLDIGPAAAGHAGQANDEGIGVHRDDTRPHAGAPGARGEHAGDVSTAAADVENADLAAATRLEQSAERGQDTAGPAEAAIGDSEVRQRPDRCPGGTSKRVRPISGLQPDHGVTGTWLGRRTPVRRRVQIVVSVGSGRGAARDIGARLTHALRSREHDVKVRIVDDLRRARSQLIEDARDVACLIGIGGDHTLSELSHVARDARVPLLPVPAGFGNIFAAELGWRASVPAVIETLERGRVKLVDAGLLDGSLFLSSQGFGFLEGVQLAVEASGRQPRRRWQRYGRYVHAALRSIVHAPSPRLAVDVDGQRVADAAPLAVVANVPTYRTFMPLVTAASPFDALLDVVIAPTMSKTALVAWLLGILVRAPGCRRGAVHRRASRVTITDGACRSDLLVMPGAVPVRLPPETASASNPAGTMLARALRRPQYDQGPMDECRPGRPW